jgi:hypothetical protein
MAGASVVGSLAHASPIGDEAELYFQPDYVTPLGIKLLFKPNRVFLAAPPVQRNRRLCSLRTGVRRTACLGSAGEAGEGVTDQLGADNQEQHGHDHGVVAGHPASELIQCFLRPGPEREGKN